MIASVTLWACSRVPVLIMWRSPCEMLSVTVVFSCVDVLSDCRMVIFMQRSYWEIWSLPGAWFVSMTRRGSITSVWWKSTLVSSRDLRTSRQGFRLFPWHTLSLHSDDWLAAMFTVFLWPECWRTSLLSTWFCWLDRDRATEVLIVVMF